MKKEVKGSDFDYEYTGSVFTDRRRNNCKRIQTNFR